MPLVAQIRACPRVGGHKNNIDGTRPEGSCTPSLERTFSNVTCLFVQISQVWIYVQRWCSRKRPRGLILYLPTANIPFVYIIRCTPQQWVCSLCVYRMVIVSVFVIVKVSVIVIVSLGILRRGVSVYHHWRGQAWRCLSLHRGNARAWTKG